MKRVLFSLSACNHPKIIQATMTEQLAYHSAFKWTFGLTFKTFNQAFNVSITTFLVVLFALLLNLIMPSVIAAEESSTNNTKDEQSVKALNEAANQTHAVESESIDNNNHAPEQPTKPRDSQTPEQASETSPKILPQQDAEQASHPPVTTNTTNTTAAIQRQVAVVNIAVLMENSPRSQAIADRIKGEYFPQEQLLNKEREALRLLEEQLDAESTGLSAEERLKRSRDFRSRKRKYTRDYEDFRDRLSSARQKALALVRQDVLEAVDHVRTKAGIDIVLEDYVLASEEVDLTPKVLQYLQTLYQQTTESAVPAPEPSTEAKPATPAVITEIESTDSSKQEDKQQSTNSDAKDVNNTNNKDNAASDKGASE